MAIDKWRHSEKRSLVIIEIADIHCLCNAIYFLDFTLQREEAAEKQHMCIQSEY